MKIGRYLAAALLAATLAAPAQADVKVTGIQGDPGFLTGKIVYTPGGIGGNSANTSQDLYVGRMEMTGIDTSTLAKVTFDTYCIDIFHFVQNGTFDLQAFSLGDKTKENQIKALLSNTAGFIDAAGTAGAKKDISAAIQMAVWEIINESGGSGYSLGGGLFQVAANYGSVAPGARALAQGYLDSLSGWKAKPGYNYTMMTGIRPAANQSQIFFAAAAVPEPGTWAMLIAGFGAVGGAMRRRSRGKLAFA